MPLAANHDNADQRTGVPLGRAATVPHIVIDHLALQYPTKGAGVSAIEGISVDIPPRSFVAIVGSSGCGKTTLLKVLSGVLRASQDQLLQALGDK